MIKTLVLAMPPVRTFLSLLLADDLIAVADTLALVGLRGALGAHCCAKLAHQLLVKAADDDACVLLNLHIESGYW